MSRPLTAPRRAFLAALTGALFVVTALSTAAFAGRLTAPLGNARVYQTRSQTSSNDAARANQGILFVGSSIFQYWRHLEEQMAPLPVLNRAVAGTLTQDQLDRVGQFVFPYQPRIIVYYCGSNDISAGEDAAPILARTKRFIEAVHEKLPGTFIYYASILKAPEKQDRWDIVDEVNKEMERYSRQARNVGFIDLNPVLFDHSKLRENLFLPDQLHFRPESTAYLEFSQVVKPILTKAWESGVGLLKDK